MTLVIVTKSVVSFPITVVWLIIQKTSSIKPFSLFEVRWSGITKRALLGSYHLGFITQLQSNISWCLINKPGHPQQLTDMDGSWWWLSTREPVWVFFKHDILQIARFIAEQLISFKESVSKAPGKRDTVFQDHASVFSSYCASTRRPLT